MAKNDDREVVIADCYDVARMTMKHDWKWTPQRIKKAVVVARDVDVDRLRNNQGAKLYFAAYPDDCYDKVHAALMDGVFEIGNPFKGSTVDPSFFQSRTAASENQ